MSKTRNISRWLVGDLEVKSGLEQRVGLMLIALNVPFKYEERSFKWLEKLSRALCKECGAKAAYVGRSYTPDFFLPNGLIIEVKGNFTSKDRKIAAAMKEQHPDVDIAMLFDQDNWLNKNHKNKYSDWCKSRDIKYAVGTIPEEWIK